MVGSAEVESFELNCPCVSASLRLCARSARPLTERRIGARMPIRHARSAGPRAPIQQKPVDASGPPRAPGRRMARQGPRAASAQALSVAFLMLAGCGGAAGDPPGLACDPPGPDVMAVTLAHAELPADLAEAAAVPVSEAEASAAGAVPYEVL